MDNLNDLYKEFFARTINCGLTLPAELKELANKICSLQNSSADASTCSTKSAPEVFEGIH